MYIHYVYELRDTTDKNQERVFYVGKGKESRFQNHCAVVRQKIENNEREKIKGDKEKQILKLIDDSNQDVNNLQELIIGRYETEEQALAVEATLIKWAYGFDKLTNEVQGHHHFCIRGKGDFSFDNELNAQSKQRKQARRKHITMDQQCEHLLLGLTSFGIDNLSIVKPESEDENHQLIWPVPDSECIIRILLTKNDQSVCLIGHPNCAENGSYFTQYIELAGYTLSNSCIELSGCELTTQPNVLLSKLGGNLNSALLSNPDIQEIVFWLKDFEIRIKLAQFKSENSHQNKLNDELSAVIDLFAER